MNEIDFAKWMKSNGYDEVQLGHAYQIVKELVSMKVI